MVQLYQFTKILDRQIFHPALWEKIPRAKNSKSARFQFCHEVGQR
jgi:hypothetical protein